jgi:energy-coupling factor transporter transmembrane protein EcfT
MLHFRLKSLGFLTSCCKWVYQNDDVLLMCVCIYIYIYIYINSRVTSKFTQVLRVLGDMVLPGQIFNWFFFKFDSVSTPDQSGSGQPAYLDQVLKL